jgi:ketosteroid isomerase-like protein
MANDVDVVRRAYAALAARDMDELEGTFAWDAVWVIPGSSAISGAHVGWPAIRDEFVALLDPLSGGTFHAELLDVAVGEKYLVAIQRTTAQFKGRTLCVTSCQLLRILNGLIQDVSGLYSAEGVAESDAFWV